MEGMTEEQKEYEAMKLVDMFDKLSRLITAEHTHTCNTCTAQYELIHSNIQFQDFCELTIESLISFIFK